MMLFTSVLSAAFFIGPVFGVPTRVPIVKRAGPVKPGSYIVTFKNFEFKNAFVKSGSDFTHAGSTITHDYDIIPAATIIVGGHKDLIMLQGAPGVESIEHDGIVSIHYEAGLNGLDDGGYKRAVETGESAIDKRIVSGTDCKGVTVYVVDTGINKNHTCFGGRAAYGKSFKNGVASDNAEDENGHGTHTASTAIGDIYGISTGSNVMAVKVLDASGSGAESDVALGIQWALNDFLQKKKPAVMSMSLGGLSLLILGTVTKNAVAKAVDSGLPTAVAAGNDNAPAFFTSPANVEQAVTVGAVDSSDRKASFSNYGKVLDIFALGVNVAGAWIGSTTATNTISGTSMATPYVAGVLAIAMCKYNLTTPAELTKALKDNARKNAVVFPLTIPGTTVSPYVGTTGDIARPW